MGFGNREKEVKLQVVGKHSLKDVCKHVAKLLKAANLKPDLVSGHSSDVYWRAPDGSPVDFFRLRRNSSGAQITLKSTDNSDNVDRIEMDLEVNDYNQAKQMLTILEGDPQAEVRKKYKVFFLENKDTNISVYQIDKDDRVFVEVEARSKKRLKELVRLAEEGMGCELLWVKSSVYQMFVAKERANTCSLSRFWDSHM